MSKELVNMVATIAGFALLALAGAACIGCVATAAL